LIGSRRKKRWIRYLFSRNLMIEFINIGRWSMFYVCYVFYQVWKSWKHLGLIHLYLCSNMQLLQNNLFISTNLIGRYGHLHVIHYWFSSHLTHCRGHQSRDHMIVGLSPLKLWVRIPLVYLIQHYVIKFVSDLRQVCGFLQVPFFPTLIKLTTLIELKCC
jgi:hypothetical protein